MARLKKNQYKTISTKGLKSPIVFVIDMINGFIKDGALHDKGILEAATPICDLVKCYPSVFVCDSHSESAREFQSYPVHCLEGTWESEVIKELKPYVIETVLKNSTNAFLSPSMQAILENKEYGDIVITGCCTDLCIMQFALTVQGWLNQNDIKKKRVIVPVDCVDTYHIPEVHDAWFWNDVSLQNMEINGIEVVAHIEEEQKA